MKKTMRKIVPAVLMLLISAMLVGTSTYAWFSMNTKVTVTGMSVSARVSDSILIAEDNSEGSYGTAVTQTKTARLAPTSSYNGQSYFYSNSASKVDEKGKAVKSGSNFQYTAYSEETENSPADTQSKKTHRADNTFQTQAGVATVDIEQGDYPAYGYLDYVFYLKATNAAAEAQDIVMTKCNLLYNSGALTANDKAWRIALISRTTDEYSDASMGEISTRAILAPDGAEYFAYGEPPVKEIAAASSATARTAVVNYNKNAVVNATPIAAGYTVFYKVIVRLWLEGEDKHCTNENYLTLTNGWTLDLAFEFNKSGGTEKIGVAVLDSKTGEYESSTVKATAASNKGTVTLTEEKLSNEVTPTGYQWKNAVDNANVTDGTGGTTYEYTCATTGKYYCVITTASGTYRTAVLDLTAAG